MSSAHCKLTLGEGGVRGAASFSEAYRGSIVRLPVLRSQGSHCWVGWPGTQKRCSYARSRAVGWYHLTEGGRVLQQTEVAVHGAHIVANVRVHAAHGGVVA